MPTGPWGPSTPGFPVKPWENTHNSRIYETHSEKHTLRYLCVDVMEVRTALCLWTHPVTWGSWWPWRSWFPWWALSDKNTPSPKVQRANRYNLFICSANQSAELHGRLRHRWQWKQGCCWPSCTFKEVSDVCAVWLVVWLIPPQCSALCWFKHYFHRKQIYN